MQRKRLLAGAKQGVFFISDFFVLPSASANIQILFAKSWGKISRKKSHFLIFCFYRKKRYVSKYYVWMASFFFCLGILFPFWMFYSFFWNGGMCRRRVNDSEKPVGWPFVNVTGALFIFLSFSVIKKRIEYISQRIVILVPFKRREIVRLNQTENWQTSLRKQAANMNREIGKR